MYRIFHWVSGCRHRSPLSINLQLSVQCCFQEMNQCFVMFISDVDECREDEAPCKVNEECSNEEGTYNCFCKSGYKKKNNVCVKTGEISKINYQQLNKLTSGFHAPTLQSIMIFLVTFSK